ncbi:prepilin-type N-terminal cleavage/methylation domain-containing protein [Pseudomonas sp.]|uniref:PilW family protein n=1 Tax=Pseudomonas sp. TaxID=306 RepID=UPI0028999F4A|nr:prepilin-type N-terminal cleavage/methylation domain-containing protein [Pseudomonas sp.]
MKSYSVQHGFSLIEMMIALTLGAFLILGVTQIYLDNKRSYLYHQGQVNNQENGFFALTLIDQQLARTGFRANVLDQTTMGVAFPALASSDGCPAFTAGQTVQFTTDKTGICFRYQGAEDGKDQDCLGKTVAAGTNVLSRISYVSSTTVGAGTLTCSAQGSNAQVLVSGLADFLWFALPDSTDGNQAIRYAALFSTQSAVLDGVSSNVVTHWNALTSRSLTDTSHAMQIVQGSVMLRNLMQ